MDNSIKRWFKGYVCVEIRGKNKERFINLWGLLGLHPGDIDPRSTLIVCH